MVKLPYITIIVVPAIFAVALNLSGCSEEYERDSKAVQQDFSASCTTCHAVELDENHRLSCTACHIKESGGTARPDQHPIILAKPSYPADIEQTCGMCHKEEILLTTQNSHYTLQGHLNQVREAFGADVPSLSLAQLTPSQQPETALELIDDLLIRRCLRCHVYYEGDDFPAVRHGVGCAACHLEFTSGQLTSHTFLSKPGDDRCLSCHYGNHVGFDYYGRFEHDYNEEYRTPYMVNQSVETSSGAEYGVEYHQLSPDIHQQAGMVCIDCHQKSQVMGTSPAATGCRECHTLKEAGTSAHDGIQITGTSISYESASAGTFLDIPLMQNNSYHLPDHRASCQACHAQWTFTDKTTHLLRIDHDDFYDFYKLSLDGSSEVHTILSSHSEEDGELLEPFMTDKLSSTVYQGIWFKGFDERRWEQMLFTYDDEVLYPARSILNLSVSWIDSDEFARFDNLQPPKRYGARAYSPHTIGHAGLFYEERLRMARNQFVETLPITDQND